MKQYSRHFNEKLEFWKRNKLPMIFQSEATECGLACIAMISCYFGSHTSIEDIRNRYGVISNGLTLMDLMEFANELDLACRPLKIEMENLVQLQLPCILHWDMNHFVVLKSVTRSKATIYDPAVGEAVLKFNEFSKHFTGIALEITPTKNFSVTKSRGLVRLGISDLWSEIVGLKRSLFLIFALSLIVQIFTLSGPYYIQLVVDEVVLTEDTNLLFTLFLGFTLLLIFNVTTKVLRSLSVLHFSSSLNIQMGVNLYHHLIRLPVGYFERRHMGDILSRYASLDVIRSLIANDLVEGIIDGIMAISTLLLIFFYSKKLALIVLVSTLLFLLVKILTYKPLLSIQKQEIVAQANVQSTFIETVRAIKTIKLFNSESKREANWINRFANSINYSIRSGNVNITIQTLNEFIFGFASILVVYYAASSILDGTFSVGMLIAFLAYKTLFTQKVNSLIEKLFAFKMLSLHFDRLSDIVFADREFNCEDGKSTIKTKISGGIFVENISFKFSETDRLLFDQFSLNVAPGELVVITGKSGSGKSTLIKLILGFYKLNRGRVLIDDIPIGQTNLTWYRNQVATVMQDDELLTGSIAENISFFESPLDIEKVISSAKAAFIHDDVTEMTMGYDTRIGEMGSVLSVGQKQRLLLARAFYKSPKILFLDESTSNLDSECESSIIRTLEKLDITRIIITHRPEVINTNARIVNLDR